MWSFGKTFNRIWDAIVFPIGGALVGGGIGFLIGIGIVILIEIARRGK